MNDFDKGCSFTCSYIKKLVEDDERTRTEHGWPLDYATLRNVVLTFVAGQDNRVQQ